MLPHPHLDVSMATEADTTAVAEEVAAVAGAGAGAGAGGAVEEDASLSALEANIKTKGNNRCVFARRVPVVCGCSVNSRWPLWRSCAHGLLCACPRPDTVCVARAPATIMRTVTT